LYVKVPSGWVLDWRWAVENNDIEFSVTAVTESSAFTSSDGGVNKDAVIDVFAKSSTGIFGVERFAPASTVTSPFPTAEDIIVKAVAPSRASKSFDSWIAPGDGTSYVVKLTWSNAFSWMKGKNVSRRIDCYPSTEDGKSKALKAFDQDGKYADERAEHMASISSWIRS
jgi:hypothetical protein